MADSSSDQQLHALVIGAGVVGICCARALQRRGFAVTVLDPKGVATEASFGNAGGLAISEIIPQSTPSTLLDVPKWLLDPLGPLAVNWRYLPKLTPWLVKFLLAGTPNRVKEITDGMAALLSPTHNSWDRFLAEAHLTDLVQKPGCLHTYESEQSFRRDQPDLRRRADHGIRYEVLSPEEMRQLEPSLGRIFTHGVLFPDWHQVIDPHHLVTGLAERFVRDGGKIEKAAANGFTFQDNRPTAVQTDVGDYQADKIVVAAGAWSAKLAKLLGSPVPLETERGYHVMIPHETDGPLLRRMILSADRKFAMNPMRDGLRIAGTVELAGLDLPPNWGRAEKLVRNGQDFLPTLTVPNQEAIAQTRWMGHRPSTPDTLPVISTSPHYPDVFFAFGHGHLGLTAAAVTGDIIAELATGQVCSVDPKPFRIERF